MPQVRRPACYCRKIPSRGRKGVKLLFCTETAFVFSFREVKAVFYLKVQYIRINSMEEERWKRTARIIKQY